MICELCGNEAPRLSATLIEESILQVCSRCSHYGVRQGRPGGSIKAEDGDSVEERLEKRERRQKGRDIYTKITNELVSDYDYKIRQGRQKMGLNQKKLARLIQEKQSIIAKLETKSMRPDDRLVKKLESTLGIKLTENVEISTEKRRTASAGLTIADMIMMQMNGKKK
ncbi:MAG: multiprotein bridging factor aMBF1 [Candidatus Thermoplasmatota archaeon]|nr:multiprotein bridging factor aMBF1 [Candidatus Thermoplasmatota archaeon]MDP7266128.1 multiprotein bridging factor aMBF1 [Candidatus Thermoplasmatota archaeon]